MPQPGIHAILALAARRKLPVKPMLATGVVVGSLLPDLDGYAQAAAVLFFHVDPVEAEATYHRTLTHSVFFALAIGLAFVLTGFLRKCTATKWFGVGLFIGMVVFHSLLDILGWFDGVGILWPFASVNLWQNVHLGDTAKNLLRSGNFLAFGGYLYYLRHLGGNEKLSFYARSLVVLSLPMAVLAIELSSRIYNLVDGALLLLFAYPVALWATWKSSNVIEGAAHA